MKCPACAETELIVFDRGGVHIDRCPQCRGVWLERGELEKILEQSREEDVTREARQESRERAVERAERHRAERSEHLRESRRDSTRLVERLFDF